MPKSRPNPRVVNPLRKKVRGGVYVCALLLTTVLGRAQWELEESHTHAALRGIHALGGGVAWASGTDGTVLRTEDGGYLWQGCATPLGAEKLDFRGIQAFDEQTAIVMSSGPGDQSRLYKTTDGCRTWKLVFTNPDAPNGFYDSVLFVDHTLGMVIGDPAHGSMRNPVEGGYFSFRIRVTHDGGETWVPVTDPERDSPGKNLMPLKNEGLFAASNTAIAVLHGWVWVGTSSGRVLRRQLYSNPNFKAHAFTSAGCAGVTDPFSQSCGLPWVDWTTTTTPLSSTMSTGGIFSLTFRTAEIGIVVGGDYKAPQARERTAALTVDGGQHWTAAQTPPHGYRSAVAYDPIHNLWITVGPNGTDISRDDGRNWTALKPTGTEPQDADQHWNALSLPFAVGPDGRIGKLRPSTLSPAARAPQNQPAAKGGETP